MKEPWKKRPNAVAFDPVSAYIHGPVRIVSDTGVTRTSTDSAETLLFRTRIKTPRGMYTWEHNNQHKADSVVSMVIEVWTHGLPQLTSDMWIMHRDQRYDIIGELPQAGEWTTETKAYQVKTTGNPTE